ncbi:MAG: alpha-glucan family phosphorylase [Trueperaceae bacterium]|nr:MAG: alpha-glucan family phosphorylase [Trueperaceae bacterium]
MKPIHTFVAIPSLPAPLKRLRELAFNLRWAWNHETIELFRRLDIDLWEEVGHNPVLMLGTIDQEKLEYLADDEGFLAQLGRVVEEFDRYQAGESSWFQRACGGRETPSIAYFSAEFGLTECLSIFAGGLGVLAGDHLKSASDLGVPLVGVGLLYQQGYFRQLLNEAGWQQEVYENNDFHNLPLTLEKKPDGTPLIVTVPHPDRQVSAQVWRAQVGRVVLYLLDTNLPYNRPEDRDITDQLYGGDRELRIKQEIVLGIGGYRALEALGIEPTVFHMNEGHAAFLVFEVVRRLMERRKLSFAEAREAAVPSLVFTSHTAVPAGHDFFPAELMDRYFADYARMFGLSQQDLLALGRKDPLNASEDFCMTVLALRFAAYSNGVSALHGEVTRDMWRDLWPNLPEKEIPISHVTNGVHFQSWISMEMKELYDRYLGPRWREEPADHEVWERVHRIAPEELWRTHELRRERLVAFSRRRLRGQLKRRGASRAVLELADEVLDSETLTIGFARRFATYKRANLLFRDPERLARILNDSMRPVQIIITGKAHPRDDPGKEIVRQIVNLARQEPFRRRLVFLEDYDMAVARYLVQGADIWLNTPLRLREACGTSGMKATANGVLNLSILDGWWDEAYQPELGWSIGRRETYADQSYQDQVEAEALYNLLEQEVIPRFYDRGSDGLPRRWIETVKASSQYLCHVFNTHRMVSEYTERAYLPATEHYRQLSANGVTRAKALAAWRDRIEAAWSTVKVEVENGRPANEVRVGETFQVRARLCLGMLEPQDVVVELYLGRIGAAGEVEDAEVIPMQLDKTSGDGFSYKTKPLTCRRSGLHGYTVRVRPHHPDLANPFIPGWITWASG